MDLVIWRVLICFRMNPILNWWINWKKSELSWNRLNSNLVSYVLHWNLKDNSFMHKMKLGKNWKLIILDEMLKERESLHALMINLKEEQAAETKGLRTKHQQEIGSLKKTFVERTKMEIDRSELYLLPLFLAKLNSKRFRKFFQFGSIPVIFFLWSIFCDILDCNGFLLWLFSF